jgi:hypothetical protein
MGWPSSPEPFLSTGQAAALDSVVFCGSQAAQFTRGAKSQGMMKDDERRNRA